MDEYIKREDLLELYRMDDPVLNKNGHVPLPVIRQNIMDIPAADVAPVRHGPCPYCDAKTNDFIPINQTVEYSGIEIALNRQGMLRVRVYESGQETFAAQDIVEINYCPNCGAKMELEER